MHIWIRRGGVGARYGRGSEAMHMVEGLALGCGQQAMVGQRERLLSLGRLSAGLTTS